MNRFEYMKVLVKIIQQVFMEVYNVYDKIKIGFVYM